MNLFIVAHVLLLPCSQNLILHISLSCVGLLQALIRRSQAYESIGDLDKASNDVSRVLAMGAATCGSKIYAVANELSRRIEVLREQGSAIHLLRKASLEEASKAMCFCMEPILHGYDGVRLRCRCVLHEQCMVAYVRSKLGDKASISDKGIPCPNNCGAHVWIDDVDALCRVHTVRPFYGKSTEDYHPLEAAEAAKFRLWVISASFSSDELVCCPLCATPHWVDRVEVEGLGSGATRVVCSNAACRKRFCSSCQVEWHGGISCADYQSGKSDSQNSATLIMASAKQCPNCHSSVTHYHGHACHHIRGCPVSTLLLTLRCSHSICLL